MKSSYVLDAISKKIGSEGNWGKRFVHNETAIKIVHYLNQLHKEEKLLNINTSFHYRFQQIH